jgi:hypothetical protein
LLCLQIERFKLNRPDVFEAPRDVEAVAHFRERRFCDIQKMSALFQRTTRKAFDDVRGNRIRSTTDLAGQLNRSSRGNAFVSLCMSMKRSSARSRRQGQPGLPAAPALLV